MEERQVKIVYGYVKKNYGESIPTDIIDMIYKFYLSYFDTQIMNDDQQLLFVNLIWDRSKAGNNETNSFTSISFELLYRGSENEYLASKFHDTCDEQGATVTIIHNEHDFIFGGYASKSWPSTTFITRAKDPHAFLFTVHPKVKVFELSDDCEDGEAAITSHINSGPVFGTGTDLHIFNKCHGKKIGGSSFPKTYNVITPEFIGVPNRHTYHFAVKEYEVFSITQE